MLFAGVVLGPPNRAADPGNPGGAIAGGTGIGVRNPRCPPQGCVISGETCGTPRTCTNSSLSQVAGASLPGLAPVAS